MAKRASIVSFEDAKKARRSSAVRKNSRANSGRSASATATVSADAFAARETRRSNMSEAARETTKTNFRSAEHKNKRTDTRETRRRERAKAKADRMFSKQFAENTTSDASQAGAPRAALYEGKMGAKHRKSARMQRSSSARGGSTVAANFNPAIWSSIIPLTARSLKIGTAVLCLLLTAVFLYSPAQQYYQAQREHERLTAEYSVIENRNEALDIQNDMLASDAGMEDAVRRKYGFVKAGEQVAAVSGLSAEATDTSRDGEGIEANVLANTVRAPEEWYTPFLDTFFGVD